MHMDPVAARRTQAGAPVVHGVHAVLWALESLLRDARIERSIATLTVRFQKFTYVGTKVHLQIAVSGETSLRAELLSEGITTTTIDVEYGPPIEDVAPFSAQTVDYTHPLDLDFQDMMGRSGRLAGDTGDAMSRAFPHTVRELGRGRVIAITRLSSLVGMVCPGLHSIFSGFRIHTTRASYDTGDLSFRVQKLDGRFRMVAIDVAGSGIAGEVTAFLRRRPVSQRTVAELRNLVEPAEFAKVTALIVGGSRGLGALTAKIIAAGGGRVIVTYVLGEDDALAVVGDIGSSAGSALRYDARDNAKHQITMLDRRVNQLYYFATPSIFRQKHGWYSAPRFDEFCQIYVEGFANICSGLRVQLDPREFAAFYPSSTAIEKRPRDMTEYAMAKSAGEVLCADMNRFARGVHVRMKRLPRLLTDQTATIIPGEDAEPLATMIPITREMPAP